MTIARSRDRKPSSAQSPLLRPGRDPKPAQAAPVPAPKPKAKPETKPSLEAPSPVVAPPVVTVPPVSPVPIQEPQTLPDVPLTRADVPPGAVLLAGELRHGIDPWRGTPYVFLQARSGGRFLRVGWRHTWGLNPEAVTYQRPFGRQVNSPVWMALDTSEKARRLNQHTLAISKRLRAAWKAAVSAPGTPPTDDQGPTAPPVAPPEETP
jgi:hypothetical protein